MDLAYEIEKLTASKDEGRDWRKDKLHPSSDLSGCLRKTCMELSGTKKNSMTTYIATRQIIGQGLHQWLENNIKAVYDAAVEFDLSDGLPQGWTGKADIVLASDDGGEFAVYDLKVISGSQAFYRDYQPAKIHGSTKTAGLPTTDQRWQISAYGYALRKLGYNVTKHYICYWPIDKAAFGQVNEYPPFQIEVEPIEEDKLEERFELVDRIVKQWKESQELPMYLAPQQDLIGKPTNKPTKFEVHQKFDWRCQQCPFFRVACYPDHVEDHIGTWNWNQDECGWEYEELVKGTKPRIFPPGKIVE